MRAKISQFIFMGLRCSAKVARPLVKSLVGAVFERASFLLPVKRLVESAAVIAFWHPRPSYRIHILVAPKLAIADLDELSPQESGMLLADILQVCRQALTDLGVDGENWRLVLNGGAYQEIPQLHFHLIIE